MRLTFSQNCNRIDLLRYSVDWRASLRHEWLSLGHTFDERFVLHSSALIENVYTAHVRIRAMDTEGQMVRLLLMNSQDNQTSTCRFVLQRPPTRLAPSYLSTHSSQSTMRQLSRPMPNKTHSMLFSLGRSALLWWQVIAEIPSLFIRE